MRRYRNDPIKRPAFFKCPPRISAHAISSMFNKRPALIKRSPIKGEGGGGARNWGLPYLKTLLSNAFEITNSNVKDAQFPGNILSDDEEDDVDVE